MSTNGSCATLTKTGSGTVTLKASITSSCSANPIIVTKQIIVGAVSLTSGTYTNTFDGSVHQLGYYPGIINAACTGYDINTNVQFANASAVRWSKVSSSNVCGFYNTSDGIGFYLYGDNQNAIFQVDAGNGCSSVSKQFQWVSSPCGGGGGGCLVYRISPNPSATSVNVIVPNIPPPCSVAPAAGSKNISARAITEIEIYDNAGNLRKLQKENKSKQAVINITGFKTGIYYIEISDGNYKERQQLIIGGK